MQSYHFRFAKDLGGQLGTLFVLALVSSGGLRVTAGAAHAEEIPYENSTTEYARDLDSAIDLQTRRLPTVEGEPTASCDWHAIDQGNDGQFECDCESRHGGWLVGGELTLLKPFHTMGIRGGQNTDLSFDLQPSPRAWLGFNTSSGVGIRARYWDFDHATSAPSTVAGRTETAIFDTYVLDLEMTSEAWTDNQWDVVLSGGLRYVDYIERNESLINATGVLARRHEFSFLGFGPTLSAYVHRPLFRNFGAFANVRGSVVMGDEIESIIGLTPDTELDNIRGIWELQLGTEWRRTLARGGELFLRAAYEVQYWDHFSGEEFFDGGESVGFGGVALGIGVIR